MRSKKYKYTKQEADALIQALEGVSVLARFVDAEQVNEFKGHCFAVLGKKEACEHCLAEMVLRSKQDMSKLEEIDDKTYQIFVDYVEIDDRPYALEIVRELNEKSFMSSQEHQSLTGKYTQSLSNYYLDSATKVYNRYFYEDMEKDNTKPAGVALIDVDDFKSINETYGHQVGQLALGLIVDIIKKYCRNEDKIIRYDGDIFLLILEGINEVSFGRKLEYIREAVHRTMVPGYGKIQLSISIGALVSEGETREESFAKADRFLHLAKNHKNQVITEWNLDNEVEAMEQEDLEDKPTILIVDDSEMNRFVLGEILKDKYNILEAEDGLEAIKIVEENIKTINLVLLDIVMPRQDGLDTLNYMYQNNWVEEIPVMMISGESDEHVISRCYELGASDYIRKPFSFDIVQKRVYNLIRLYQRQRKLQRAIRKQMEVREKDSRMMTMILSQIVEIRNGESGPHVVHVEQITEILLQRLSAITDEYPLTREARKQISIASALHDIGKIGIPEEILNKPGRLTDEEFEIIKTHTTLGANMIDQLTYYQKEPLVRYTHDICRWHHEKWDGKGYPDGLKGDEIPIAAQVVSVADCYDALVSKRVYKDAYSHQEALQMLLNGRCGQFNPKLMQCLSGCHELIVRKYTSGGANPSIIGKDKHTG